MTVKEYSKSGNCEIHTETKLIYTGDEYGYDWYECQLCKKEEWKEFYKSLEKISKRVKLRPTWKGGEGLGITCPQCKGEGLVLPETLD